jgi:hypothetical protein
MKSLITVLILLLVVNYSYSQSSLKIIEPKIGPIPQLDAKAQQAIERRDLLAAKNDLTDQEIKELDALYQQFDETIESVWDIIGGGCSWYCGGGPYQIKASSHLKGNSSLSYEAENIHDLSFHSAWVEGAAGFGTGEYVEYYFKADSPRITEIKVYNGYVKSEQAWKNNGRVKQLKLYVNSTPFALLPLKDTTALQTFTLSQPMGRRTDGKDLVLRFEIVDIYKGDKFEDTALTEIFFDGIDVH